MNGWNHHSIRELELESIFEFVSAASPALHGRVLDFGAGKPGTCRIPQPYRHLIIGTYCPYDLGDPFPTGQFDAILCTQVLQYIKDVPRQIREFAVLLRDGGHLVMTYPTNWDEVEDSDLWRFTKAGVEQLLGDAGFKILKHHRRAQISLGGFNFPLGYGVIAQI
jgi:SAM-dependent methyltransferase